MKRRMNHPVELAALTKIWADQLEFNQQFRENPSSTEALATTETKELVLHLHSETDEVLRASGAWKIHRKQNGNINRRQLRLELADVFKYWISICQVHGFSPEEMMDAYWEKSMAVRQRYSEEFVQNLNVPSAVVDIDNVLADYIKGFIEWCEDKGHITHVLARDFLARSRYVDARSLGVTPAKYEDLKHAFRVSGWHARLPLMPGAQHLLHSIKERGLNIILLTSRPIDKYPNLYSETLVWLKHWNLPFNAIWWAANKGELCKTWSYKNHIAEEETRFIHFAIDDEWQYVRQFSEAGIPVYWLTNGDNMDGYPEFELGAAHTVTKVRNLKELTQHITEESHGV